MRNLVIRDATAIDIPAIVKVRRTAFTNGEVRGFTTPERSIFYSQRELKRAWAKENQLVDGWKVLVAEDDGGVVGFIVFKVENGLCYIDNVNISKDKQRTGVGRALVSHVEELARRQGIHRICTDTTENAEGKPWKSYAFWIRMGYKDVGERRKTKWSFKEIPFVKNI
jgi:N-acetylglutamate synthase-like GNAT family acetyltransferase